MRKFLPQHHCDGAGNRVNAQLYPPAECRGHFSDRLNRFIDCHMSKEFDPYHTWLGIPPEEQPADHYRLLGLKCWETNLDVISHASDQRLTHLRNLQNGKRCQES